jgi:hypothetical protein
MGFLAFKRDVFAAFFIGSNNKVKIIRHQAIGKYIAIQEPLRPCLSQKEQVIVTAKE